MQKYNIHKDFRVLARLNMRLSTLDDIHKRRLLGKVTTLPIHITKDLKIHDEILWSHDGQQLKVEIFAPKDQTEKLPCILFYHGGGFMLGLNEAHYRYASEYAKNVPCVVVMVDYRLAPEYPFPNGVEDCYSALLWAKSNAEKLHIDTNKFAVVGESAGGSLSAAIALMSRDRGGPKLACQMLVYPTTDNEQNTYTAINYTDTPVFYSEANTFMWTQYLKDHSGPISPYAAPMRAKSLVGLPPAYVETAEFDPLHDEGLNYANRMIENGVDVTIHETIGTVHGYDALKRSSITKESMEKRYAFLKEHLLTK